MTGVVGGSGVAERRYDASIRCVEEVLQCMAKCAMSTARLVTESGWTLQLAKNVSTFIRVYSGTSEYVAESAFPAMYTQLHNDNAIVADEAATHVCDGFHIVVGYGCFRTARQ